MYPVLLEIGGLKFYSYGLMIAVGFLVASALMRRDAKRTGIIDPDQLGKMTLWSLLLGVTGTRVLHIVMYPQGYSWLDPIGWIDLRNGGLVFHGAIPAVILYSVIELRRKKIPFWSVPDLVFPYVPLAHAFGRIGCLLYSCCYGKRAGDLAWAIRFPEGSQPYIEHAAQGGLTGAWSHPIHPTQLYSAAGLLLLCAVLLLLRAKWNPFPGFTLPLYFAGYGILRFIVEMFRGDGNPTGIGFGVLSDQQVYCVIMMLAAAGLFLHLRWRSKRSA